jgi:hypothetical protein
MSALAAAVLTAKAAVVLLVDKEAIYLYIM